MQGTVLAPLKCSISIDKIANETSIELKDDLYKYRECVTIPPLSMIDDILAISKCSINSVRLNAKLGAKIDNKLLRLGEKKCSVLHVGRDKEKCKDLLVNGLSMKTSDKEKYLGSIITSDGKPTQDIVDRHNRGIGVVNQILGLLKELHFGHFYFEMALLFRNSMLINGILCSIEALYTLRKSDIEQLESCDKYLFRKMFDSLTTTATEAFYLETGSLPLRFIISARRLMYFHCLLSKPDTELAKQVLIAQMISPIKDNWIHMVRKDLELYTT